METPQPRFFKKEVGHEAKKRALKGCSFRMQGRLKWRVLILGEKMWWLIVKNDEFYLENSKNITIGRKKALSFKPKQVLPTCQNGGGVESVNVSEQGAISKDNLFSHCLLVSKLAPSKLMCSSISKERWHGES